MGVAHSEPDPVTWPAPSMLNPDLLTKERKIGEGGFGEVWLGAYNDSQCVIKSLRPRLQTRPEFVRRFAEEISLMSKLSHPNVVIYYGATPPPHQSLNSASTAASMTSSLPARRMASRSRRPSSSASR